MYPYANYEFHQSFTLWDININLKKSAIELRPPQISITSQVPHIHIHSHKLECIGYLTKISHSMKLHTISLLRFQRKITSRMIQLSVVFKILKMFFTHFCEKQTKINCQVWTRFVNTVESKVWWKIKWCLLAPLPPPMTPLTHPQLPPHPPPTTPSPTSNNPVTHLQWPPPSPPMT